MGLTEDDYLRQLQALLPLGPAWPKDDEALLSRMLGGLAAELSLVDYRVRQLVEESDPRSAYELLLDWERISGLGKSQAPVGGSQTMARRRDFLVAQLTMRGGQSVGFFKTLARGLGYEIEIDEPRPFRAGVSHAGEAVNHPESVFTWRVSIPGQALDAISFRAGESSAGERLIQFGDPLIETIFNKLKPAHTRVFYIYKE